MIHQQILKQLLMCAVLDVCAILNLAAEGCPELVVILRLILLHLEQLVLDLLSRLCAIA